MVQEIRQSETVPMKERTRELVRIALPAGALVGALATVPAEAADVSPDSVLNQACTACHEALPDGRLNRISDVRKTPEGWDMTVVRMRLDHGLQISSEDQAAVVKYLSDRQGLAPSETADYQYALERTPVAQAKVPDEPMNQMCGRCHSFARVALTRRDADEWRKAANFHLGQFPSLEYQDGSRSLDWWKLATTKIADNLGSMFPFSTQAWTDWQKHVSPDLSGKWRVVGHRPGAGDYDGTLTVKKTGADHYSTQLVLTSADGQKMNGDGPAVVYTGYQWRASVALGRDNTQQVFTVSVDGNSMTGRWFLEDADQRGANMSLVRESPGTDRILVVEPSYVRAGQTVTLTIAGVGLSGKVDLGPGIKVVKTAAQSPDRLVVEVQSEKNAADGQRSVAVGSAKQEGLFTVFHKVDMVRVEPDFALARLGDNGGPIPSVTAQYEAVGYLNASSGKPEDAIPIGVLPAKWSVQDFDDTAKGLKDSEFAGTLDQSGLFHPAGAGPNPQRQHTANNTGNLKVIATVNDNGNVVTGSGHLIVTIQRWNSPPIR